MASTLFKSNQLLTVFKDESSELKKELTELGNLPNVTVHHLKNSTEIEKYLKTREKNVITSLYLDDPHFATIQDLDLDQNCTVNILLNGEGEILTSSKSIRNLSSVITLPKKRKKPLDVKELYHNINFNRQKGIFYFLGDTSSIVNFEVTDKSSKNEALKKLNDYVLSITSINSIKTLEHFSNAALQLLDELLLNSIFNANPRYKNSERDTEFKLEEAERVQVQYGANENFLVLSVKDPFGSLSKEDTIKYAINKLTVPFQNRLSGGKGLRTVFENIDTMIIDVAPDQKTEIICVIKLSNRFSLLRKRAQVMHFCNA